MSFGEKLTKLRKEEGMSQEDLANSLNVSRQAVSKWESDGAIPEIDKLIALSKIFEVSIGWLLGVEQEASDPKSKEGSNQPCSVTIIIHYDL